METRNAKDETQNEVKPAWGRKRIAVTVSLAIMLLGVLMVCQPVIQVFFRFGFLVTIIGIVAFTYAGHMKED